MPTSSNDELKTRLRLVLTDLETLAGELNALMSRRDEAALERWPQLTVQICVDLGDRILAARNLEEPPRQRDVFAVLLGEGVLTAPQARRMEKLTEVRNALVHDYGRLTAEGTLAEVRSAFPVLRTVADALIRALPP